jgi:hypothetical protein
MQEFKLFTKANLMKVLRFLPRLFVSLVAIAGIFLVGLFIYNLEVLDEDLYPEVLALTQNRLSTTEEVPAVKENAFYALMGMRAEADKDMSEVGVQLVEHYLQNRTERGSEFYSDDYYEIVGAREATANNWLLTYDFCSSMVDFSCLEYLATQLDETPITDQRLVMLMQRYDQLLEMPFYYYPIEVSNVAPTMGYQHIFSLSQIRLANLYNKSSADQFLSHLNSDIQFWKLVLRESVFGIEKMISVGRIHQGLNYLSEHMRKNTLSERDTLIIRDILKPLTPEEADISESYVSDTLSMYRWLDEGMPKSNNDAFANWLAVQLTRKNDAKNAFYSVFTAPLVRQSKLSAAEFSSEFGTVAYPDYAQRRLQAGVRLSNFSNLGRNTLIASNRCNNCEMSIARIHNLEGVRRMVELQLDLSINEVDSTEEFILDSDFTNPYTGEAFNYNSLTRILSFNCIERSAISRSGCRIQL